MKLGSMLVGLEKGELFMGSLRISSRNRHLAFAAVPGLPADVVVDGVPTRNRALNRDIVVLKLDPQKDWRKRSADKDMAEATAAAAAGEAGATAPEEAVPGDGPLPEEDAPIAEGLWKPSVDLASHGAVFGGADRETSLAALGLTEEDVEALGPLDPEVLSRVAQMPKDLGGETVQRTKAALLSLLKVAQVSHEEFLQPTGSVVGILQERGSRDAVGVLLPKYGDLPPGAPVPQSHNQVRLAPLDQRIPWIMIPREDAPPEFLANPEAFAKTLFRGTITRWSEHSNFPLGHLAESLGQAGDIEAETQALLKANGISDEPFSEEVMESLQEFLPRVHGDEFDIPEEEVARRRDLRSTRIFSIDPWSARDLDDALHVTPLPDGTVELGVHIADVSYFVRPDTALDREAAERATSVYLVQRVLPMLPRLLCESLCSLNPGVDRLAFSCIWRMTREGDLVGDAPWVGRTVIRSCAKLDYGTAQKLIDGALELDEEGHVKAAPDGEGVVDGIPEDVWPAERRPSDGVDPGAVVSDVQLMNSIAKGRRAKRFLAGAISLNRNKMSVQRDRDGNPVALRSYPIHDSNRLVEEYMLLANYLVAQHLIHHAGSKAVLRDHPPPLARKVPLVEQAIRKLGFPNFQWRSGRTLQASLLRIKDEAQTLVQEQQDRIAAKLAQQLAQEDGQDELQLPPELTPELVQAGIESMVMGPMKPAEYFTVGTRNASKWKHYGLGIPYYTHFTSPIRRYADVMVHRLLQATLDGPKAVEAVGDSARFAEQCEHCNERKFAAKGAQEMSDQVFMCLYLKRHPTEKVGIVTDVSGSRWFNVAVPEWGLECSIHVDRLGGEGDFDEAKGQLLITPAEKEGEEAEAAPREGGPSKYTVRTLMPIRVLLVARTNTLPIDYEMIPVDLVPWNGPAVQDALKQAQADGILQEAAPEAAAGAGDAAADPSLLVTAVTGLDSSASFAGSTLSSHGGAAMEMEGQA